MSVQSIEVWKDIPDFWGYQVSNLGNVRTKRKRGGGRANFTLHSEWCLLAVGMSARGYRTYGIEHNDGKRRRRKASRLVLLTFVGAPTKGAICRHLNDQKLDDRLENLEWGTQKENCEDARRNGVLLFGERSGMAILNERKVLKIRKLHALGMSYAELGRRFNIDSSTARQVCLRKTRRHI